MKNKIVDLRNHLFETIEALKDPKNPMEIARAKAIANAAQVIVNSVKVEVDYIKITGVKGSGFVPDEEATLALPDGAPRKIVHHIK